MDEERNTAKANRQRYQRDKRWRKRKAARDQYNPESLEQRAMMAVVAPAYEVTQDWGSGFQAEIELQNLDVEAVNDWTISFNYGADITSIWDATVVAREGDRYTIANAGWNADLEAGRSVAFGFIGSPDVSGASVAAPVVGQVNGEPIEYNAVTAVPVTGKPSHADPVTPDPVVSDPVTPDPVSETGTFDAVFNVISDWGSGFTGEVAVQNLSSETLKGWEVSFDFGGDINSIWNGAVVNQSGSRYTVRGALWNPDISSGGTVTFGFNGTPGGTQAALENFVVMGIHDGPQPIAPSPVVPAPLPMPAPTPVVDPIDGQGNVFTISPSSSDIVGFNPSADRLEFGDVSVHNLIVGKTESGEVAIVNPWAWSPEYQVVSGVAFSDLTAENFGIIVNEHLRQDIGGVLSWELGVGPRDANTVYVRSHEYGVQERVEDFDPATTKLSFLYFGTRERLSVDDTDEGLLISVEPTGQSVLLVGVAKSDLVPSNIEFHHDQMVEDQLEVPFGFTVEQLTMVSRSTLVTPEAPAGELTDGFQTSPGSVAPHDGHDHSDHDHGGMPMDPVVTDPVVTDPVAPVMPPMDGHDGHDDMPMDDHDGHDHMAPPASSGEFIDITAYGTFHDSNNNSHNHELVGGRTAITTEAMDAYNNLRAFLGLSALTIDDVGEWAFAEQLTNNADPYGNDIQSVGLWYAMQGAKVGWIAQDKYDPQILADIQRTARLGDPADVMSMVREFGISGYADYLEQYGIADTFISTLKMEPHYGGVMHGRTHGYLSIEGVAINHDVNHLTVLSWDQSQPFMNDTFDWPQWPALDVSDAGVMEYYQSMVVLGDPVGLNMESVSSPVAPPVVPTDPVMPPMDGHDDHGTMPMDPVVTDPVDGSYTVVASTTDVSVLVDSAGLAYVSESGGDAIAITRSDDYWQGSVPLTRDGATILAAARDDLGRLRVLDGGGVDVYAWVLSDSGVFVGEDSPSDTSIVMKETLFQLDIDGDGMIGHDHSDHDHGGMPMDPVVTDPVVTDPVVTDPVVTDPVVTDPVVTDPVVTDPVVTDPVVTDPVVTDPVVTDPSAAPIANYDKVLAAYFPEWGIYGRDYQLADVPADELTHLIYAFADLNSSGEMTLFDSYAATEKRFSAEESVTGEADQWYYPPEDPRSEQTIWGNFNQLALLKEANPHLTISIAVGGWTLSDHFSTVTSTQAGRDTFSDSIVEFLTTYQVFDGIDFDWEYPGGGGESGNSASPNDGANYALLMTDVRAKLDDLGSELGRTYEISIASPGGLDKIANFNLAGLAPSVDFFNVMTYDFHGTWEDTTGHQAAFTGDPVGYDIETSVEAYLNAGVAPEQIVLGAPLYTRAWSGVADGGDGGYNEASSGAAPGTFEAGNYDYKDLLSQINAGAGWELYWDDNAQASYVYNAEQDIFSSFETTTSIALKAEWADAMGLGGMMFWDLSNDATNSPDSLISAAFRSMVLEEDLAEIEADSSLPDPIVVGGDGEIGPLPL